MQAEIRRAEAGDAARLHMIAEAAYLRYVPRIGRRPAPMDDDFAGLIAAGHVLVAGRPALGYAVSWRKGRAWHLSNVAVAPEASGRGIGRCLIAAVEARARAAGADAVELYTNAAMVENLALYPHLGYEMTGERVEHGFHRVFFRKPLAPPGIPG